MLVWGLDIGIRRFLINTYCSYYFVCNETTQGCGFFHTGPLVGLTFVVEVIDVVRTRRGYQFARRTFGPADDAVPLWRAEAIWRDKSSTDLRHNSSVSSLWKLPWPVGKDTFALCNIGHRHVPCHTWKTAVCSKPWNHKYRHDCERNDFCYVHGK